jgi:hypothetical protein
MDGIPDHIGVLEALQLFQYRDLPEKTDGNSILVERDADFLEGHQLAVVVEVAGLIYGSVSAGPDECHLFVVLMRALNK